MPGAGHIDYSCFDEISNNLTSAGQRQVRRSSVGRVGIKRRKMEIRFTGFYIRQYI